VSVLLDGEESEIIFIDHPSSEMSVSFGEKTFLRLRSALSCVRRMSNETSAVDQALESLSSATHI
jgi:hypothetical protein